MLNKPKKRILYIVPTSNIGGAETFVKTTTFHKNVEPHYFLFQQGELTDWLKKKSIKNIFILHFKPRLKNPLLLLITQIKIYKYIKKHNIDIVHSTMAYACFFSAIPTLIARKSHIWFQHGPVSGLMDIVAALLPNKLILTNSYHSMKKQAEIEKKYFFKEISQKKNLSLASLYNSPNPNDISIAKKHVRKILNFTDDTTIFTMLCRLQRWKGVHLLTEAVLKIKHELPPNIKFVVWGDNFSKQDDYLGDLKNFCHQHKLPFIFPGKTNEPQNIIRGSDFLINASTTPEPFGLSIIEALSQGIPVIAPDEGGPTEIIKDKYNGLLFQARNYLDLSEKIKWIIKNANSKMKENCLEDYQKNYTIDKMIKSLETTYLNI